MDDKIIIFKTNNADTRSADNDVTKEELFAETSSHISDVKNVGNWLAYKLQGQVLDHDYTKIEYIDEFYNDFSKVLKSEDKNFKDMPWFKERHLKERHHLNDSVPEDVNLIDVLEMVIDCTVAGLARSGDVYDINIPQDVLKKAIDNTKDLIIANTRVVEGNLSDIDDEIQ